MSWSPPRDRVASSAVPGRTPSRKASGSLTVRGWSGWETQAEHGRYGGSVLARAARRRPHARRGRRPPGIRPQRDDHGRRPAGAAVAPARQGVQVDGAGPRLAAAGHRTFCCATIREVEGMAAAELGDDLLLANEVLDCRRLGAVVAAGGTGHGRRRLRRDGGGGRRRRCPGGTGRRERRAPPLRLRARGRREDRRAGPSGRARGAGCHGLRGPSHARAPGTEGGGGRGVDEAAPGRARRTGRRRRVGRRHRDVRLQPWATEIQAGSYCLMDTEYLPHAPAFRHALYLWGRVISVNPVAGRCSTPDSRPWAWTTATRRSSGRRLLVRVRRAHHLRDPPGPPGAGGRPGAGPPGPRRSDRGPPRAALGRRRARRRGDDRARRHLRIVHDWPADLRGW